MAKRKNFMIIGVPVLILLTAIAAFYWNEARKEVVFLCGNFGQGVSESSVRTQLETGNFLRYRTEALATGSRIVVDSTYNLSVYKCTIEFDLGGNVKRARIEQ